MANMSKLSTESYKGVRDFYPEDKFIQNYIFKKLRETVERFGYVEYDASVLEPAELYKAKTGEEIINEQTYTFTDRGEREDKKRDHHRLEQKAAAEIRDDHGGDEQDDAKPDAILQQRHHRHVGRVVGLELAGLAVKHGYAFFFRLRMIWSENRYPLFGIILISAR